MIILLNEYWTKFWSYSLDNILPALIILVFGILQSVLIFNIKNKFKKTYTTRINFYFKKYQRKIAKLSLSYQMTLTWEEYDKLKNYYEEKIKSFITNLTDNSIDRNEI